MQIFLKKHWKVMIISPIVIFAISVLIYAAAAFSGDGTKLSASFADSYTDGWYIMDGDEKVNVTTDLKQDYFSSRDFTIYNVIPPIYDYNSTLSFVTANARVEVYIQSDNGWELIYKDNSNSTADVSGEGIGTLWNFVDLPAGSGGKVVRVQ